MKEEVYFKHSISPHESLLKNQADNLCIKRIKPKVFGSLHSFLWSIETFFGGTYVEYQLWRGDKLVSKAEVVSWIPQFTFMPKTGLHIGPCVTVSDERGHGYYPYLLSHIVVDSFPKECFMIVSPNNLPSSRGVEKAGFRSFATGYKTRLGRYVIK